MVGTWFVPTHLTVTNSAPVHDLVYPSMYISARSIIHILRSRVAEAKGKWICILVNIAKYSSKGYVPFFILTRIILELRLRIKGCYRDDKDFMSLQHLSSISSLSRLECQHF